MHKYLVLIWMLVIGLLLVAGCTKSADSGDALKSEGELTVGGDASDVDALDEELDTSDLDKLDSELDDLTW